MTDTNHTDSFETKNAAIQLTATLDREVFKGQYSSSGLEAIEVVVARELATLQAHTSQQVDEVVRAERSRIYGRLAQMKSVYVTMDTGSALVALMGEDIIREEAPNHQD